MTFGPKNGEKQVSEGQEFDKQTYVLFENF